MNSGARSPLHVLHLNIGEILICRSPEIISTVLGSCVSVCLYSKENSAGGMVHYAHPQGGHKNLEPDDYRYGTVAIPALIDELAHLTGHPPSAFKAKVIGGASDLDGARFGHNIGEENVRVAERILAEQGIEVIARDTGGARGRKVLFHTSTGLVEVALLGGTTPLARHPLVGVPVTPARDLSQPIIIGASTGGTEAIKQVLTGLPERIPPIVIAQHIPPLFSKAFADRLNDICPFDVKEAEDGDEIRESRVLIAPGGRQMKIDKSGDRLRVVVNDDPPVNRHKPSVDYLFFSAATALGRNCIGIILTGMGSDGAQGLLAMKRAGALTLGQDEKTSVVYGMPKAAKEIGALQQVLPLEQMATQLKKRFEGQG